MKVSLLDHGYVELVESWGSDERIIEAARMSTAKGFQGWGGECASGCGCKPGYSFHEGPCTPSAPGDEKLLRFLWEHKHATPFEMAGLIIEVQAPIFVFREWHRHRTQSYNELSARYTPLPDVNYIPTVERLMANAGGGNRQAGTVAGAESLTTAGAESFRSEIQHQYAACERLYQDALGIGVPKELARLIVPVGRYSRMRASANLRNWLQFLTLRMAPAAQWEIRQYANAVGVMIKNLFPRTWYLFEETKR
jgi:thymidylate synthase (FAD)